MAQSVLFVCLGNICRSPLAEGAMRDAAIRHGLDLHVDSAGTGNWHSGQAPDRRARAAALAAGVDISGQAARQIAQADFASFNHIVAMERGVLAELDAIRPDDSAARLSLFLDHVAGRQGEDVADPYYGDDAGFLITWEEVRTGAEALAALFSHS